MKDQLKTEERAIKQTLLKKILARLKTLDENMDYDPIQNLFQANTTLSLQIANLKERLQTLEDTSSQTQAVIKSKAA